MARQKEGKGAGEIPVRTKMLASAMELFNRKGYAPTTVREIVAEAGVTKPVLYYYFGNKEGIYRELMGTPFVKFDALLSRFQKKKGPARRLLFDLCDQSFKLIVENLEVVRIMYSIYYGPPQGAPFIDFEAHHMRLQETVRQLIVRGMERGEFVRDDIESVTWAVIGALTIAMEMQLSHPERGLGRDGLARVLELILDGIARRQRKGARNKAQRTRSKEE